MRRSSARVSKSTVEAGAEGSLRERAAARAKAVTFMPVLSARSCIDASSTGDRRKPSCTVLRSVGSILCRAIGIHPPSYPRPTALVVVERRNALQAREGPSSWGIGGRR